MSLFAFVCIVVVVLGFSWHSVPEGFVGVYYRGGALLDTITESGFHTKLPLLTRHEIVQVTMQTDRVENIECGTSGGGMLRFC
jgi:regulator of protease activity HflC (stomatin/prohibitin superfamily)